MGILCVSFIYNQGNGWLILQIKHLDVGRCYLGDADPGKYTDKVGSGWFRCSVRPASPRIPQWPGRGSWGSICRLHSYLGMCTQGRTFDLGIIGLRGMAWRRSSSQSAFVARWVCSSVGGRGLSCWFGVRIQKTQGPQPPAAAGPAWGKPAVMLWATGLC